MKGLITDIFLDSGAYTAWKQHVSIDLDQYCDYILENKDRLWAYVALDVIPGKPGMKKSSYNKVSVPIDYDGAAAEGFKNYQHMVKRGLDPIPVVHQGENWKWLYKYMEVGATYIGLSTAKDTPRADQKVWLDDAFTRITDKTGKPLVKTHGFGITSVDFVMRYPWYSYDSAGWAKQAAAGKLLVPGKLANGKGYDYGVIPRSVVMSASRHRFNRTPHIYEAMTKPQQQYIRDYIESEGGITVEMVRDYVPARRFMNILYFQNMSKALHTDRFLHRKKSTWL